MKQKWQNWGRTEQSSPQQRIAPAAPDEVVRAVQDTRNCGGSLRAVGAGHSFSAAAMTDGVLLDLSHMRGLISVDTERNEVRFWAGTFLWEIPKLLQPYGLALENMGDIDRQTLAGAVSTGTHGTGSLFGSFSSQVVALQLVNGRAVVCEISRETRSDLLPAASLSLGALGVLLTITLRCVPAFLLHAIEQPKPLGTVLTEFEHLVTEHDHFEFYWFPHTSVTRTKVNKRVELPAEIRPQNYLQRFFDEEVANNLILGSLVAFQHVFPRATPRINTLISTASSRREYVDEWFRVFVTRRRVRFREMEYALPRNAIPEVMRELEKLIDRRRLTVSFPIEVRTTAAEAAWLSPSHGKEAGYLAVHRYWREKDTSYFALVEELCLAYGGLPHWGKMHSLKSETFRERLPKFSEFLRVRDEMDPERVFRNGYLDRVMGK